MKRYRKYIRPYLGAFILGSLLTLTEVMGETMLPKLVSMIINNGMVQRNVQYIPSAGGLMILATFIVAIGGIGGAYLSVKIAVDFTNDPRDNLFSRVQESPFENIDPYSTGSLVTRLTNDIQQAQNVFMVGLWMTVRTPGVFIGALIMAFTMDTRLAVVIPAVIPLLAAAIVVILKATFPKFTAMQEELDQLDSGTQEMLTNVRVIKSLVQEKFEEKKFRDMNQDLKNSSLGTTKVVTVTMPVMTLAMNIATLAVAWHGGNIIVAGDIPMGDLTAFTAYIAQILMSLMILSMMSLQPSRAVASIRKADGVMDTRADLVGRDASRKDLVVLKGKVEFKHVSFSYTDNRDEMVLEDTNFTAEPGQIIGIIDSTGSGKATLVQMMPRLYDVTKDQVLVDGADVRGYSLKNLRGGVGMVLQKDVFFSGTVEGSLRQDREDASMDETREMVRNAQADSLTTSFASGYDTDMGQGGANASGGQKQKSYITRALLRRPKILILDDSTNAVDTATGARIRQCFSTSLRGTIKIVIAQCIGFVGEAGRILVLDEDRLIGQGAHEQLMEECKAYQEIYYSRKDRKETAVSWRDNRRWKA